ncbi:MAG: hypothetical protein JKY33_00830, partial [Bacteroidia bacterium]|nr:hypothetical protein [Bacteroidia bacterium]
MQAKLHKYSILLLCFLLLITSINIVAQDKERKHRGYLEVNGRVKKGITEPLGYAHIQVYEILPMDDLKLVQTDSTSKKGKFKFDLSLNREYKFQFYKKGFISKSVEISTFTPEIYWDEVHIYPFEVEMYEQIDDSIQATDLYKPAGLIFWNDSTEYFDFDKAYTLTFKKEQERLRETALSHAELLRIQKEQEAKTEAERLNKEALAKADFERAKKDAEAIAEEERLKAIALKKAEEDRLEREAETKAEEERLKKEAEALAKQGKEEEAEKLRKEAEEFRKKKEAEAKAEEERLTKEAEAEAKAFRLMKEAEAEAVAIKLKKQAEAEAEVIRLQKEAEAETEAIRLIKEARAKATEIRNKQAKKNEYT